MESDPNNAALRLSHLLSGAAGKDPDEMDAAERECYLSANGVNVAKARDTFRTYRERIKKRCALQDAAVRRKTLLSMAGTATAEIRARAQAALDRLMQRDPAAAQIYARKFETSDAADLNSLLDDMMKLEIMQVDAPQQDPYRKDQG